MLDEPRVRDLGPLRVVSGGEERPSAGEKQAALLAVLTMNAGHRVPIDDLVVGAWGYDATVSNSTVENHVWRLRRLLDPGYSRASRTALTNDSGGYRLDLSDDAVDSSTFETLAGRARTALEDGLAAAALHACDTALELWRGTPYDVIAHLPATAAAAARLEEIRGQINETRLEALIRERHLDQALTDLGPLLDQFPYRERLWGLRMSALAGSGRTEEALVAFGQVRQLMREELGIEPGPDLQRLQQSILSGPAGSEGDEGPAAGRRRNVPPPGKVHLPQRALRLLGRADEVELFRNDVRHAPIVTVTGAGGCGKTRLAIEVARGLGADFADGVWFVDLSAVTHAGRVADVVAATLGLASEGPDTVGAVGAFLSERRALLVLDNCEHVLDGAAEVAVLAGDGSGSAVLVTSRQPLSVTGEVVRELPPLSVRGRDDPDGSMSSAAELFWERSGRSPADPVEADDHVIVEEICRAVDGLPLAIELAAARAETFTLAEILSQVTEDPSRLGRIGRGADERFDSLRSAIELSHRLLEPRDQSIHRRLAVLPGVFTLPAATAVAQGTDLDVADVAEGLARLVHRSLLVSSPPMLPGRSTRFRQLETVRAHARQLLEQTDELAATTARRDRWVHQLVEGRPRLGDPASKGYYDNLDDAYAVMGAAWGRAASGSPDPRVLLDGSSMLHYWFYRHRGLEGRTWMQSVADAGLSHGVSEVEPYERVQFRIGLAAIHFLGGDVDIAGHQLGQALPVVQAVPEDQAVALGEALVAAGNWASARREYAAAQQVSGALATLAHRCDDPELALFADQVDVASNFAERTPEETAALAEAVYQRAVTAGNHTAQWTACGSRVIVAALAEDPQAGLLWVDRMIAAHSRLGHGGGGAFLEALGNFASLAGDVELAIRMHSFAHGQLRKLGAKVPANRPVRNMVWPSEVDATELRERARSSVSADRFAELWDQGQSLTYEQVARSRAALLTC